VNRLRLIGQGDLPPVLAGSPFPKTLAPGVDFKHAVSNSSDSLYPRIGLHVLAIPVPSSLANAKSPGDSNGGRILLKLSVGIVRTIYSSNVHDNASRHQLRTCNIGTSTDIPSGLKHFSFGHVHWPVALGGSFRRFVGVKVMRRKICIVQDQIPKVKSC